MDHKPLTEAEEEDAAEAELSDVAGVNVFEILRQGEEDACAWAEGVLRDALTHIASGSDGETLVSTAVCVLWVSLVPEAMQAQELPIYSWFAKGFGRIGTDFSSQVPGFIASMRKYREPKPPKPVVDPNDLPF